jgi:hypothetical protein
MQLGGLWDFINNNPLAFSQTVLSLALVVATFVYTYFTWGQTSEMEQTREQSNQPVVKGGIGVISPGNLAVTITNTGNGAAHNVHAEMFFDDIEGEDGKEVFRTPILTPGEEFEFGFPVPADHRFVNSYNELENLIEEHDSEGILTVETECESAFEEEYSYTTEIDVMDVKENLSQIIMDGEQEKMRKALQGIESNLGEIADATNQEYQDELAHQEIYHTVLNIIESEEEIGFEDLRYRTGVQQETVLHKLVRKMERAGLVSYPSDENLMFGNNVEIQWEGGSVKDVDEGEIGGASGQEILEELQDIPKSEEDDDEPEVEKESR